MAEPPSKAGAAADAALPGDATGLARGLAAGVEALSGVAMDAVQVHRNSPEPAALGAPAGTAGADGHPEQNQHPHEGLHVVKQKAGRTTPSKQWKGGAAVEDDAALEREADRMGAKAAKPAFDFSTERREMTMAARHAGMLAAVRRILAGMGGLLLLLCAVDPASARPCPGASSTGPTTPSSVRSLEGRLVYHNDIRRWFELQMRRPECGQKSVQVTSDDTDSRRIESLRGCWIRATGALDFSPTGYYSRDVYLRARRLTPVGTCARKRPFRDWSRVRPARAVRSYRVAMDVDYRPGDHPIAFHVRSAGKELRPWQAYARYMLTGGFVLYGLCGEGFAVDRVEGTPEAHPSHADDPGSSADMASYDPETAAAAGKTRLHLGYTCVRIKRAGR